jgi:hypothetical protein
MGQPMRRNLPGEEEWEPMRRNLQGEEEWDSQ